VSLKKLHILNPHRDDFIWEPLYYRILKRRPLKKYNHIADLFKLENQIELVVSDNCSGILPEYFLNLFPSFIRKIFIKAELERWKKINAISRNYKIKWLDEVKPNELDSLFFFQLYNLRYLDRIQPFLTSFANIYIHLSHYYLNTIEVSKKLSHIPKAILCGDSDISDHPFFKKYFSWYQSKFVASTFFIHDRFQCTIPFKAKQEKIISTGTFHPIEEYPQYHFLVDDWQVEAFHYNRRSLYNHKEENKHKITCINSPWVNASGKWWKKVFQAQKVSQKKYFSIDIVKAYNQHKYAIVGEEICGFPGIGTFEAMACGCVTLINPNTLQGVLEYENCYIPFTSKVSQIELSDIQTRNDAEISKNGVTFINCFLRREQCIDRFINTFLK
jgi:hypothetical protein